MAAITAYCNFLLLFGSTALFLSPLRCKLHRRILFSWLPSMGSHRVGHNWSDLAAAAAAAYSRHNYKTLLTNSLTKANRNVLKFRSSNKILLHSNEVEQKVNLKRKDFLLLHLSFSYFLFCPLSFSHSLTHTCTHTHSSNLKVHLPVYITSFSIYINFSKVVFHWEIFIG